MTWDNVIGVDTNSRLRSHSHEEPGAATEPWRESTARRTRSTRTGPRPELANHRTPIEEPLRHRRIAGTSGSNAGSSESYNCYKIIAKDLGLDKPWEEPGKEEPDSLVEQQRIVRKRVQDSLREGA